VVFCVPFSALTLMGGRKSIQTIKPHSANPRGLEQVQMEDQKCNRLTQVHLDRWPLSRSSSNGCDNLKIICNCAGNSY